MKKKIKYRFLRVGEIIRANDEYFDGVGWNPTTNQTNRCNHAKNYRRPILRPSDAFGPFDEWQVKMNKLK